MLDSSCDSPSIFQESLLLEPMFEVPGANITEVHVTEEYVMGEGAPVYVKNTDSVPNPEPSDEDELNTSIRVKQWE